MHSTSKKMYESNERQTTTNNRNDLINIIHDGLKQTRIERCDIGVQCSVDDWNQAENTSYSRMTDPPISSFNQLTDHIANEVKTNFGESFKMNQGISTMPTLRQLSLNALNQWNEEIKHSNPTFDKISVDDLLQDINDEDALDELALDHQIDGTNHLKLSWSLINSLENLHGELSLNAIASSFDKSNSVWLPLDEPLSLCLYQSLQKYLGTSKKQAKPIKEKKFSKENKNANKQQWNAPGQNDTSGPSLKHIMEEELNYNNKCRPIQRRQLDFANEQKLKELERHFPEFSSDLLYDMFTNNDNDYEVTFVCITSMLDDSASIKIAKPQIQSNTRTTTTTTTTTSSSAQSAAPSYEISRCDAHNYAMKRKDCYRKADQANRHGMGGVASYYINQAREQTLLMKDANRTACEHLSNVRLDEFRKTHKLDLHELHADEALRLFKEVEQDLNTGNRRTTPKSIEVITGYGKNSPYGGGSGKIRSIIVNYLKQKNYKYSELNRGSITVQF